MTRIAPEARSWLAAIIALPLWRSDSTSTSCGSGCGRLNDPPPGSDVSP